MKNNNEKIIKACAFCEHATFLLTTETVPALSLLKTNLSEENIQLTCPYKKNAAPDFVCRRFRFDPLKYRPHKMSVIPTLDEDALLLN